MYIPDYNSRILTYFAPIVIRYDFTSIDLNMIFREIQLLVFIRVTFNIKILDCEADSVMLNLILVTSYVHKLMILVKKLE